MSQITKVCECVTVVAKKCDSCGEEWERNTLGFDEFTHIDHVGGYGSVFGDGTRVTSDICETCLKNLLESALVIQNI
jgi:hypothetical protein